MPGLVSPEFEPLIAEQAAANTAADRADALAGLHFAAQARIPLQNRLAAAHAAEDAAEREAQPKPQCFFCDTTSGVTFRPARSRYGRSYHVCGSCAGDVSADRRDDDRDYTDLTSA